MKALVISDIHGNIDGLQAVWEAEKDSDIILCIGDMVDVGFFGADVIQWMMDHRAFCVRGNHDDKFLNFADRVAGCKTEVTTPYSPISYSYSQMSPEQIDFLRKRPEHLEVQIDGIIYGLTHKYSRYKVLADDNEYECFSTQLFGRVVDRMIFGHTHFQLIRGDKYRWMNPGSVCYNRGEFEDSLNAFYMTIEDGEIIPKQIEYDVLKAYDKAASLTSMSNRYMRRINRKVWKNIPK
jgi:putative phosphoesterase